MRQSCCWSGMELGRNDFRVDGSPDPGHTPSAVRAGFPSWAESGLSNQL
jgi:hypothetical protein